MLAVPTIKGERTLLTNGLYQIVADGAEGGKLIALFNSNPDLQFNVVFEFTEPILNPLAHTKADGTKYALSIYPGETKEFVSGKYRSVKKQYNFGAPDKAWLDKRTQEVDKSVELEIAAVKDVLQRNPRADKKYSADYVANLCVDNHTAFVDVTFLPRASSLARDFEGKAPSYMWMRPVVYCKEQPCLFVNSIEPNDIDQGQLGDCYLMCAMACASEYPALVKDLFSPQQVPQLGIYRVRLCKNGWWQVTTIDDLLPINPVTRLPAYAKNREEPHELWVSLIEKAYAKLYGSYAAIRAGDPAHALADLLGFPFERFSQLAQWQNDKDSFFEYLMQCNAENCIIALGTPGSESSPGSGATSGGGAGAAPKLTEEEKRAQQEKYKAVGLTTNHAFSLLKVRNVNNVRLCQIRNPWGNDVEWNGAWSDDSNLWTPEMMDAVNFTKADDGTFWMCWEDVIQWFDGGSIAYVNHTATQLRVAGNFDQGVPDVIVKLHVSKPLFLWFGCHQRDSRGLVAGDKDQKYCGVQVSFVQDKPGASNVTKSVVLGTNGNGSYQSSRDTFGRIELTPSEQPYYVLAQAFQDIQKSFVLSFFIEDPSAFSKISFVSFTDGTPAKKRYNPASAFHSSFAPVQVSAQYQLLLPQNKVPIEQTGELVNFSPPLAKTNLTVKPKSSAPQTAAAAPAAAPSNRKSKLYITIVSGKDLVAKDIGGTSDPYVTINLYDEKGKRYPDVPELSTRFIKNTLNPVWGEKFTLSVYPTDIIFMECWDKDLFGRDAMGSCRFTVQSLGLTAAGDAKREAKALKGGDATGELELLFTLS
ncbi:calpain-like cysteine peptidase, putative [Bodo saltans]|uniref:Calpain-like cysteine peptidase, putative n=1 Tax=Bodo saltans TaxID=75058 RepID=A0A0S4JLK6_BODSA|nr:calpain-like cysteine peptidase, putative [Bodo saltans]|eukprot:CUG89982.1 calpain-like cysteine peptidase, putative [Bodo saltans]